MLESKNIFYCKDCNHLVLGDMKTTVKYYYFSFEIIPYAIPQSFIFDP